jgi:hypothetical protein
VGSPHFGEPEVEYFCLAPLGHENICRLYIAMNNALGVRCIQGVGNLDSQIQNLVGLQCLALDTMLQGLALEQFHRDESLAFFFADVVNRADVGMIEGRRGLSFAPKTAQSLGISRDFIGGET